MKYEHRQLSLTERDEFRKLFERRVRFDFLLYNMLNDKAYSIIYPIAIITLTMLTMLTIIQNKSIFLLICYFCFGLISTQLLFSTAHIWAHSLMLEYSLWDIKTMKSKIGNVPIVIFAAFYHHHSSKYDDWMNKLSYHNDIGSFIIAMCHWHSFSLLTMNYPMPGFLVKVLTFLYLVYCPHVAAPYFLGYEIGVFLLPISHDWVHKRNISEYYMGNIFSVLETIGLFATKDDHKRHHIHTHTTIYQGFTSSGLYSSYLDSLFDKVWDYFFNASLKYNYPMYEYTWWLMTSALCVTLIIPLLIMF